MDVLQQYYESIPLTRTSKRTVVHKIFDWCKTQEKHRLLWLAVILTAHGCFLTPLTVMFVMLSGNSMLLWALALGAMAMALVVNLAALPTKITLPVFLLSLVIDLVIVALGIIAI